MKSQSLCNTHSSPKGCNATEIKQDDKLAISQDSELVMIRVPLDVSRDPFPCVSAAFFLESLLTAAVFFQSVEKPTKSKSAANSKPITKDALNSSSVPVPGAPAIGREIGEMLRCFLMQSLENTRFVSVAVFILLSLIREEGILHGSGRIGFRNLRRK
ncbi:hypothetical protein HDU78_004894 [Chytriomyces hyalinus]|nr:hypothetical protein HDU78_004894 [Chytriomyces hyalinus]